MAARQPLDFSEGVVNGLRIKRSTAIEEGLLVTKIADVRAAARNDDRVGNQIDASLDQIPSDGWQASQRSYLRAIDTPGPAAAEISEEARPRPLAGADEDRVCVRGCFVGQRGDVQPAESYVSTTRPIVIREFICTICGRDVNLNHHEVRRVVQIQPLDVFVLDLHLVAVIQVPSQSSQPERWKERVLDRAPEWAGRFGQRRKDHFDLHCAASPISRTETSRGAGPSSS